MMASIWDYLKRNRNWIIILIILSTIEAILNIGVIVAERMAHHMDIKWRFYIINEFTGSFTILVFLPFLLWFFKRFPLQRPNIFFKIIRYILVSLVFGILYTTIMYSARVPLYKMVGITRLHEIFNDLPYRYLMEYFKQFFAFWIVYLVYWAFRQYQNNRNRQLKEVELKEQLMQAQLKTLQMQLNPHFFFNTLNTISSIMYTNPSKADRIISQLSIFLRSVLGLKDQVLHALSSEIDLLKQFTEVMKSRYPDKLEIVYEVNPSSKQEKVPVLLLQPIVENAIHYGIDFNSKTRVTISTQSDQTYLYLKVSDNGPGIQTGSISMGTGLTNTFSRLDKIYKGQHRIELVNRSAGGLDAIIALPKEEAL